MKIELLERGLNVAPVYWALQKHPEFWNENTARTQSPDSPHHGLDDIWARYGEGERAIDGKPHEAFWYPCATTLGVKPIVHGLMAKARGEQLGGVLITRIPAGATCQPHVDEGWHARHYEKFAVQIASAPGQRFCFEGEALETMPGDVFWFDNQHLHWVENPTNYELITMIVCIRREN